MALTKEQLKNISEHAKYMAMTSSRETLEKMRCQSNEIHDLSSMHEVNGLEDLLHYCEVISSHKDEIEESVKQGNIEHSF